VRGGELSKSVFCDEKTAVYDVNDMDLNTSNCEQCGTGGYRWVCAGYCEGR
jgi:hypothetical protein